MKRKWQYWLGMFLLVTGLLAGCGRTGEPTRTEAQPQAGERTQEEVQRQEEEQLPAETQGTETERQPADMQALEGSKAERAQEEEAAPANPEGSMRAETEGKAGEEAAESGEEEAQEAGKMPETQLAEDGVYTSRDEVAEYIYLYGHLPDNFITKKEAKALGWVSSEGNLAEVAPGKSIGGDYFGNYEGNLPEKEGRDYHECDIDSDGGYRGAKRIVYSNDGLIYYTEDHYGTFELLYGEE